MKNDLSFAIYAIKKNIQGSAELRTSFLTNVIGMMINNTAFILLWVFFINAVGQIGGWTPADIIGLNGFAALTYGLAFSTFYGIRKMPDYAATGAFDRFMLSPKNLLVRVSTSAFSTSAVGDVLFGIVCLGIFSFLIRANVIQLAMLLILAFAACLVFISTIIIIYSIGFLFTDGNNVSEGIFQLFFTPAMFDGGAYQGGMRLIFTFIIPSLLIGTMPIEAIKDLSFVKATLVVGLSAVWFLLSILIFNRSVKKYESSNFMTFGN
jgi:ABC-2 type transport system permease protein